MNNAFVLCSGGLDSVVTANYVKKVLKCREIKLLFFDYGQRSLIQERKAAFKCAKKISAKVIELKLPELNKISGSLINKRGKTAKVKIRDLKDSKAEGEKWYVPLRNALFLTYANALAESLFIKKGRKSDIFVGFKNEGLENYPDTSQEFLDLINKLSKNSTKGKFKVSAPLINKDKEEVVLLGEKLGVSFEDTFSCYIGKRIHCGYCLACRLRQEGFYWANIDDPTRYQIKLKDFRRASDYSE